MEAALWLLATCSELARSTTAMVSAATTVTAKPQRSHKRVLGTQDDGGVVGRPVLLDHRLVSVIHDWLLCEFGVRPLQARRSSL